MAGFLVDANVLSEATKAEPDPTVVEWLRRNERLLVVDPVMVGEIRFGILLLPEGRRRRRLEGCSIRSYGGSNVWPGIPGPAYGTGLRWAELLAQVRGTVGPCGPRQPVAATALTPS